MTDQENSISNPGQPRPSILGWILGWGLAGLVTTALSSMLSTWFNLQEIVSLGADIRFGDYASTMAKDFASFAPTFLIVTLVGMLIAFLVAGFLRRFIKWPRALAYGLAGAAAMAVMLTAIQYAVAQGMQPVGAAKTTSGYILLLLAGAIGGVIFARIWARFAR